MCCAKVVYLIKYILTDIEETDVESVSEGSTGDLTSLGDCSFLDFNFSASKTDSLPFTVQDAGVTVTRKSRKVCYHSMDAGVFLTCSVS